MDLRAPADRRRPAVEADLEMDAVACATRVRPDNFGPAVGRPPPKNLANAICNFRVLLTKALVRAVVLTRAVILVCAEVLTRAALLTRAVVFARAAAAFMWLALRDCIFPATPLAAATALLSAPGPAGARLDCPLASDRESASPPGAWAFKRFNHEGADENGASENVPLGCELETGKDSAPRSFLAGENGSPDSSGGAIVSDVESALENFGSLASAGLGAVAGRA
jgi:hypothetical protein